MNAPVTVVTDVAISVEGVSKAYPGVQALKDVSLSVTPGEVHGVVGENGAGKSTLMGVISGTVTPDEGTVMLSGHPLDLGNADASRDAGIAIVRQEPALLPDLTVGENVYLGMPQVMRPKVDEVPRWATAVLARWSEDLAVSPTVRVEELPPEHRFIVEISRAITAKPRVLILDEPTEHLAADDVVRLFDHIRQLTAEGVAVIYISHRVAEVKMIADRISVLRNGESKGTHDADALTENDIVNLIVGRKLEATFPPKADLDPEGAPQLVVSGLTGHRFHEVDLRVRPGEVVGLAGIDGNGQREFLRALAGMHRFQGEVEVQGQSVRYRNVEQATKAGITYVAADRHREGVIGSLSVRENIALRNLPQFTKRGFVSSSEETATVEDLSRQFNVKTPNIGTNIGALSGGNQQKAVLAGAFGSAPSVLLLDEPTQGVDVGARSEIYSLIRAHAAESGMATIVLSTDAKELAGIADRVYVFSRGRIVSELVGDQVVEERITGDALNSTAVREQVHTTKHPFLRWLTGDTAPIAVVGVAVVLLTLGTQMVNPFFLSAPSVNSFLTLVATLAFAAMAQSLVLFIGGIDLSIGPLMGFLVVVQSFFLVDGTPAAMQGLGWALFVVIPIVVGFVNWAFIDLGRIHPMIATLVTFTALQALSLMLRPVPGGVISRSITSIFTTKIGPIPVTFLVAMVLAAALTWLLFRTRPGVVLRAVGSEESTAAANGLKPRTTRLLAYVGASMLASLGALTLMAQLGSGDPSGGTGYTLTSIAAAVIGGVSLAGGRGTFIGALIGAVLLQITSAVTTFLGLTTAWQSFLVGGLTILAVASYSKTRSLNKAVEK